MAKKEEPKALERSTEAVKREKDKKPGVFKRIGKWFREMKSELKKVVWPTKKQVVNNTAVSLVVMAAAAVVLWGFDTVAQALINTIISVAG